MFSSRIDAGRRLGQELTKRQVRADLILGVPRGGMVVAYEIAKILKLPLDALVVKKLGAPHNPELAIGALTYDDVTYIDTDLVRNLEISKEYIKQEIRRKHHEFRDRDLLLRKNKPSIVVRGKQVIVADDGVATGATLFAALEWLHKKEAKKIIVAIPVATRLTVYRIRNAVDKCVILEEPDNFGAVGEFYSDFRQVMDEEVVSLLNSRLPK